MDGFNNTEQRHMDMRYCIEYMTLLFEIQQHNDFDFEARCDI